MMKEVDVFDYLYKTVRLKTRDGRMLEGDVVSVTSGVETDSGYAEMDIDYGTHREVVDESEIQSIEVLEE